MRRLGQHDSCRCVQRATGRGSCQLAVTARQSPGVLTWLTWLSWLTERHIPTWQWDFYFARLLPIFLLIPIHVCSLRVSPFPHLASIGLLTLFPGRFVVICRVSFAYKALALAQDPIPILALVLVLAPVPLLVLIPVIIISP